MQSNELKSAILQRKQETGAVILAHTYQPSPIQDIADFTADSYALSAYAAAHSGDSPIIVCGVRFMAETVKILSPSRRVILPTPGATCPMAEQTPPERIREYKKSHPGVAVAAYVNTTAQLKAECDVCVTSSSALQIIRAMPQRDIVFIPDRNLGAYVKQHVPEKNISLWDGCCPIHDALTEQDVLAAKAEHPEALVAMHPECRPEALRHADMIGSTKAIIEFMLNTNKPVIIGTERGVGDRLIPLHPEKTYYLLSPEKLTCPDMKKTSLSDVYNALSGGGEEIVLPEAVLAGARRSLDNMLKYGG